MAVVDVIIVFVIILSAFFSLLRGFVKEAISLTTWVVAIWLAATFASQLADVLPVNIESVAVRQAIGFAVLFILTLMMGALINKLVSQLVNKTGLSGADRIFGVAFGVLRGGLIVLIFVVISTMTPLPEAQWWQSSVSIQWFENAAIVIQGYIPENFNITPQTAP